MPSKLEKLNLGVPIRKFGPLGKKIRHYLEDLQDRLASTDAKIERRKEHLEKGELDDSGDLFGLCC